MEVVRYREGFRARVVAAADARDELIRIRDEAGSLTATGVVDAARPEGAVLHPEFEWDPDKAVEELALQRARSLIRAVIIVHEATTPRPSQHVFVHVPSAQGGARAGTYEPLEVVAERVDLFVRAFDELVAKLESARAAVDELRRYARTDDQATASSTLKDALDQAIAVAAGLQPGVRS